MVDFKKLGDLDLYNLIGVEFTATEAEVSWIKTITDL